MNIILDSVSALPATGTRNTQTALEKIRSVSSKVTLFVVLLAASLAIYLFGANYEPVFATNGNIIYIICTTAGFLIAAIT
ncbi:MAG: hypothetical protein ACM3H7_00620, partial [Acidobacteriaceae bacterium]